MTDDIQFGELEQAEPDTALRPDQDAHFLTANVGELRDGELRIFVDLDVMRDMEAHALGDTRVELGGVMLGKQRVDASGQPYVVVTDSLRAEHYEATRGSFKFTHETWRQITAQRDRFHPDLEMVGWYHTHPGWSVFLSGMDLFICNHFFNRPLDVALVIDPCEQDRGWFQWTDDQPPQTRRTSGFVLTTGRYRADELNYFARLYNQEPVMSPDPRYSSTPAGSNSVQVLDHRRSTTELAVIGMWAMQFLVLCGLAWYFLMPTSETSRVAQLQAELDQLKQERQSTVRERAQQEVLSSVVAGLTGDDQLVDRYTALQERELLLRSNLEGQLALGEKLERQWVATEEALAEERKRTAGFQKQLAQTRSDLTAAQDQLEQADAANGELPWGVGVLPWYAWLAIGAGIFGAGGLAGFALRPNDEVTEMTAEADATEDRSADEAMTFTDQA